VLKADVLGLISSWNELSICGADNYIPQWVDTIVRLCTSHTDNIGLYNVDASPSVAWGDVDDIYMLDDDE
jgi:hypothetical protein